MACDVVSLKRWRSLLALAVLAILVLSLMPPSSNLPTTGWDKGNHMLGFGTLGLLGMRGWPDRPVLVMVALLIYGGVIELLQSLTPYRSAEWSDLVADGIGLMLGWITARLSLIVWQRRNKS